MQVFASLHFVKNDDALPSSILTLLSGHIQNCVGKQLDGDIVGDLWNCFCAIRALVDKWYVNLF